MKIMKVNDGLSVGPQPSLNDFNELRSLGFTSVINNRPDGEEPGQPTGDEAALWLGLTFPRDPAGRGYQMQAELYDLPSDSPKARAVLDWVAETRGVMEAPAD